MILLLLSLTTPPKTYYTDIVELNHYYSSDNGRLVYDQLIWWDWDGERYQIVAFYVLPNARGPADPKQIIEHIAQPNKIPYPVGDWLGGLSVPRRMGKVWKSSIPLSIYSNSDRTTWEKIVVRDVISKSFRETWTAYDIEILEKDTLPSHYRKGFK